MHLKFKKITPIFCILYLLTITIILCSYFLGYNFLSSDIFYGIFHIFTETVVSIIASSIFFLIHYSYPYEKNTKYLISGSLFLTVAAINTYHIYLMSFSSIHNRIISSNMIYIVFAATIILLASLPDKKSSLGRWITIVVPMAATLLCFLWIRFDGILGSELFIMGRGITPEQADFNIYLGFMYFIGLVLAAEQYRKNRNTEIVSLLYGILFFILSWSTSFLYKYPNDIYSIMSHITKFIAIIFIFRGYFVTSIKKPYEGLNEALKYTEDLSNIKTDFIINLSHELRTPVNVILNATRIIETGNKLNPKYTRAIEKNALRINKLCESIIHFNEIEHDLIKVSASEVDVVYLIDEILEEAEPIADEKELEIFFDFENGGTVVTDSEKLKIILLNLLSNAFKYAPKNGCVRIMLNISNNLELTILNNGPNIPMPEVEKVFDKFYKSKDNNLESTEGLGIGLYISRRYTEFLGGNISIINHNKFTGYKLLLPVIKGEGNSFRSPVYNVKGFFSDIN